MFVEFLTAYKDFIIAMFTSVLMLGGAAAGAYFTRNKERRAIRRKELIESYASFFRAYTAFLADRSVDNKGRVVAALEIARLLFPSKSSELFEKFERMLLKDPNDTGSRADLLDQIRKQAADDLVKF